MIAAVLSKHSRAARRAISPSIDADRSFNEISPEKGSRHRPSVLAVHANAGVSKKVSKRKLVLSSKARRRHDKALERAEAVAERTISKVERSKSQGKAVQSRRKDWDAINRSLPATRRSMFDSLSVGNNDNDDNEPQAVKNDSLDSEMAEVDSGMGLSLKASVPVEQQPTADEIPAPTASQLASGVLPAAEDDSDGIL